MVRRHHLDALASVHSGKSSIGDFVDDLKRLYDEMTSTTALPPLLRLPCELLVQVLDALERVDRLDRIDLFEVTEHHAWQRVVLSKCPAGSKLWIKSAELLDGSGQRRAMVRDNAKLRALRRNPDMCSKYDELHVSSDSSFEWSRGPRQRLAAPQVMSHLKTIHFGRAITQPISLPFAVVSRSWDVVWNRAFWLTLRASEAEHSTLSVPFSDLSEKALASLDHLAPLLATLTVSRLVFQGTAPVAESTGQVFIRRSLDALSRHCQSVEQLLPALEEIILPSPYSCEDIVEVLSYARSLPAVRHWLRHDARRRVVVEHAQHLSYISWPPKPLHNCNRRKGVLCAAMLKVRPQGFTKKQHLT